MFNNRGLGQKEILEELPEDQARIPNLAERLNRRLPIDLDIVDGIIPLEIINHRIQDAPNNDLALILQENQDGMDQNELYRAPEDAPGRR